MEMFHEPRARLPQSRFAPHVVQPQHQVDFVIAYLRHVSLLALVRPLAPRYKFSASTFRSLSQCLAVEAPSAHVASTRGTPRPGVSARSAPANEPWFQCASQRQLLHASPRIPGLDGVARHKLIYHHDLQPGVNIAQRLSRTDAESQYAATCNHHRRPRADAQFWQRRQPCHYPNDFPPDAVDLIRHRLCLRFPLLHSMLPSMLPGLLPNLARRLLCPLSW